MDELFRQGVEKGPDDTKPEVTQAMNAAKANVETRRHLKESIRLGHVTDAQVKAHYDMIAASPGEEEYRRRIIAVADDATANALLAKLKSSSAFAALARHYSIASTRAASCRSASRHD